MSVCGFEGARGARRPGGVWMLVLLLLAWTQCGEAPGGSRDYSIVGGPRVVDVPLNGVVRESVRVRNLSSRTLEFTGSASSCTCVRAVAGTSVIGPGETGSLGLVIEGRAVGVHDEQVRFRVNSELQPSLQVDVLVKVGPPMTVVPEEIVTSLAAKDMPVEVAQVIVIGHLAEGVPRVKVESSCDGVGLVVGAAKRSRIEENLVQYVYPVMASIEGSAPGVVVGELRVAASLGKRTFRAVRTLTAYVRGGTPSGN